MKVVFTGNFIKSKRFRELYEKQTEGLIEEPGTNICTSSHKASIKGTDLQILVAA